MSRVSLQDSINPKPLSEGIGEEYPRHRVTNLVNSGIIYQKIHLCLIIRRDRRGVLLHVLGMRAMHTGLHHQRPTRLAC
jgi:hypothetical protein